MLDPEDHRQIGQNLDLFHFQEEAPGMVFWHPRGFVAFQQLRAALARVAERDGFEQVQTPELLRRPIWEMSGHLEHYRDGMFALGEGEQACFVKPVSCPGHLELFRRRAASYRDLPLRYAEFGVVHRNEPSGTLHGLFRLREFTQDDGHIFCSLEQVESEVARFCASVSRCYAALGFERVRVAFATRPAERAGSDALWDLAEAQLERAAESAGLDPELAAGAGAFYGPKLEFSLEDRAGRSWQCGTVQLDIQLPERFGVSYIEASGKKQRPVMLHRAVLGSLERFLGILLEQHRGRLPAWLAPEQVRIVPIAETARAACAAFAQALAERALRARIDQSEDSLARRIQRAHEDSVARVVLIGERELAAGTVRLRAKAGQQTLAVSEAVTLLAEECRAPL